MSQLTAFNRILAPPLRQGKVAKPPATAKNQLSLRPTAVITGFRSFINTDLVSMIPQRPEPRTNSLMIPPPSSSRAQTNVLPQNRSQFTQNVQPLSEYKAAPIKEDPKLQENSVSKQQTQSLPKVTPKHLSSPQSSPAAKLESLSTLKSQTSLLEPNIPHPQPQVDSSLPQKRSLFNVKQEGVVKGQMIEAVLRQLPLFPHRRSRRDLLRSAPLSLPPQPLSNSPQPFPHSQKVNSAAQPDAAAEMPSQAMLKKQSAQQATPKVFTSLQPKIRPRPVNPVKEVRAKPAPIKEDAKSQKNSVSKQQTQSLPKVTPKHLSSPQSNPAAKLEASPTLHSQTSLLEPNIPRPQPQVDSSLPQKRSLFNVKQEGVVKGQMIEAVLRQLPLFPHRRSRRDLLRSAPLSLPPQRLSNSPQPFPYSQKVNSAAQPDAVAEMPSQAMLKKQSAQQATPKVFTSLQPKIRPRPVNPVKEVRAKPAPIKEDAKSQKNSVSNQLGQALSKVTPKYPSSPQSSDGSKVEASKTLKPQKTSPQLRPQISRRSRRGQGSCAFGELLELRERSALPSATTPLPTPPPTNSSIKIEIGQVEIIAKAASKPPSPKRKPVRPRSHGIESGLTFFEGGN